MRTVRPGLPLLLLSTALAVGCNQEAPPARGADGAAAPAASATTNAAPTIGVDVAGIDRSVKPGDDFDAYANGAWRKKTEIPANWRRFLYCDCTAPDCMGCDL